MKKTITTFVSLLGLVILFQNGVHAEYFARTGEKLGRGVVNLTGFPVEITKAYEKDVREDHFYKLLLVSPMRGLANGLKRLAVGVYEVGTFWIPQGPILKPAYITPDIKEFFSENADGPS